MEKKNLFSIGECLTVNLTDKNTVDMVALHETGHVITMYALGMMNYLAYVTKKAGAGMLGCTEMTDEYKSILSNHANTVAQAALDFHLGKDITRITQLSRTESAKLYLPNICRLFGGGSICRYYHLPDEKMCSIDYSLVDTILAGLGLVGAREILMPLVDQYLTTVFASLDLLTKTIYKNLVEHVTLDQEQVMQIIHDWEAYKVI
jgi:hypothetical protein